ncbi:hypothetical protein ACHAWO_007671 [Cyclotella atomus]|uniref:Helicase-associated domain-containing protein n=1 Tax=Cyclotella atomus TaxID=382360 RepID=A0ABD3Q579_9STRA
MSRYNIFPSATHGPSLHTTKQLLQDIIAFQRTITNRESVELYNSRANLDTICAVVIPRHKDDHAFESCNRKGGKGGHYVKDIVEQMSIAWEKKKKDRTSQVLEELLKQDVSKEKEETKVSDDSTKVNLDIGASRQLRYLARKHENVFIQVATERGYLTAHIDDLIYLRARLGSNVLGPFGSMNKIRTDPEWEVEIKQRIECVHAQTARGSYKKAGDDGEGEDNRKYLLNMIQFPFETVKNPAVTAASEWSKMYNELRNFHTQRGHVRVLPTDNAVMYHWAQDQQEAYKQNTLTDNRKYLLDQVQFPFESTLTVTYEEQHLKPGSDWYNYYKELSTFHAKNGHCRVFHEENELLYQWTMAQRKTFEDGELSKNRKFLLDQVNFPWPSQRK